MEEVKINNHDNEVEYYKNILDEIKVLIQDGSNIKYDDIFEEIKNKLDLIDSLNEQLALEKEINIKTKEYLIYVESNNNLNKNDINSLNLEISNLKQEISKKDLLITTLENDLMNTKRNVGEYEFNSNLDNVLNNKKIDELSNDLEMAKIQNEELKKNIKLLIDKNKVQENKLKNFLK